MYRTPLALLLLSCVSYAWAQEKEDPASGVKEFKEALDYQSQGDSLRGQGKDPSEA